MRSEKITYTWICPVDDGGHADWRIADAGRRLLLQAEAGRQVQDYPRVQNGHRLLGLFARGLLGEDLDGRRVNGVHVADNGFRKKHAGQLAHHG